ncbi:MAG: protein phosphatase 2C domain-containing protein [Planctomycetes bacterium]|nr:protein phosphatase 2C domain-containing protein [Planctomycetota bacterium]
MNTREEAFPGPCGHDALAIVSPACLGNEEKNQDRVFWSPAVGVAAVCDGVTTSPFAAEAAELVSKSSPLLFGGELEDRLRVLCELLVARRLEARGAGIKPCLGMPEAMQEMLREVAEEKMARAFQTTLAAAWFVLGDDAVCVTVVRCGDSGFFAFGSDGTLLVSSLPDASKPVASVSATGGGEQPPPASGRFRFGPGDELHARVLGTARELPIFAQKAGMAAGSGDGWLVCAPVDQLTCAGCPANGEHAEGRTLRLGPDDLLLVPKYLCGAPNGVKRRRYVDFPFSRSVRVVSSSPNAGQPTRFSERGSTTAVLPDSCCAGGWVSFQDRFPADSHFVLASDGFYGAFDGPAELLAWLRQNEARLIDAEERDKALHDLHVRLQAKSGDDDISFVWVRPGSALTDGSNCGSADGEAGGTRNAR